MVYFLIVWLACGLYCAIVACLRLCKDLSYYSLFDFLQGVVIVIGGALSLLVELLPFEWINNKLLYGNKLVKYVNVDTGEDDFCWENITGEKVLHFDPDVIKPIMAKGIINRVFKIGEKNDE